jgi:subtilisin-like proprotein convertase family protein
MRSLLIRAVLVALVVLPHGALFADPASLPFEGVDVRGLDLASTGGVQSELAMLRRELGESIPLIRDAELILSFERESLLGRHLHFSQTIAGEPVVDGGLVVTISHEGVIRRVLANLAEHPLVALAVAPGRDLLAELIRLRPEVAERRVLERSRAYRNVSGRAVAIERFTVEEEGLRLVIYDVDGNSGEVIAVEPRYLTATGRVFPANPVVTLNDPSLRDHDDAASAVPQAAYSDVELLGLFFDSGWLSGPAVQIVDIDPPFTDRARIEEGLIFERDRPEFEEVNLYHHIDQAQRYLQSLGYTGTRQIVPSGVRADAHANNGADNSFFIPSISGPLLLFGDGGVDDAEDPDIILHEYAHAIHDSASPGTLFGASSSQARAISEGFADYWAFSSGYAHARQSGRDPYCIGDWDARCGEGPSTGCAYPPGADCLRRVDSTATMVDYRMVNTPGTEHRNGMIWSSLLREIFTHHVEELSSEMGRRTSDIMILESLHGLPMRPGFDLLVRNMLDADEALGGSAAPSICAAARFRGIGSDDRCLAGLRGEMLWIAAPRSTGRILPETVLRQSLEVGSTRVLEELLVSIHLDHSDTSVLEIALVAPDDTRVLLKPEGTTISTVAVFGRDTMPAESLAVLTGRPATGSWTLEIAASRGSVHGTLRGWSLIARFEGDEPVSKRHGGTARIIPAVAHTAGAAGTFFVSDLALSNSGTASEVLLVLTPSGVDGTLRYRAMRVDLPSQASLLLRDVVRSLFDFEGTGTLAVIGGHDLHLTSRTYNIGVAGTGGTFGQTIPSVTAQRTADPGEVLHLTQVRATTDYRTNIGAIESEGTATAIRITLRDHEGAIRATTERTVPPFSHLQFPLSSIADGGSLPVASVEIRNLSGGAIAAYASIVDNRSGDSVFVQGETAPSQPRRLHVPVVARTAGAAGTDWKSDLWLHNPTDVPQSVVVRFHQPQQAPAEKTVLLPPHSSSFHEDVVRSLFDATTSGWIEIDPSRIVASSRTWNDHVSGSFGQSIPAFPPEAVVRTGGKRIVPLAEMNSDFRTNVGATEVMGESILLQISVDDEAGHPRCSFTHRLPPLSNFQTSIAQRGCEGVAGGRIVFSIESGDGGVIPYASIVDQVTGDPSWLSGE